MRHWFCEKCNILVEDLEPCPKCGRDECPGLEETLDSLVETPLNEIKSKSKMTRCLYCMSFSKVLGGCTLKTPYVLNVPQAFLYGCKGSGKPELIGKQPCTDTSNGVR